MSYVLDALIELVDIKALKSRGLPAIRHPDTGELLIGRRGESHNDIADRHGLNDTERHQSNRGFYDPLTKLYHTKAETGLHSHDLASPRERTNQ